MSEPLTLISLTLVSLGVAVILFWPESGFLARLGRVRLRSQRVLTEDILKHAYKCELEGRQATIESMAGVLQQGGGKVVQLVEEMRSHELVQIKGEEFHLTGTGRRYALHVIRAHRLWESYLAEQTGVGEIEWHRQAEREEHMLTRSDLAQISARLRHPVYDPHGDPIPTDSGTMITPPGIPLTEAQVGIPLRIVHVEDEPEVVYSQLVAEGLKLGMTGRVTEKGKDRLCFVTPGEEHFLAPIIARNVSVVPVEVRSGLGDRLRLTDLKLGKKATILGISQGCRGAERRRFMDLGLLPGTTIEAELSSPAGNPRAYRVRGTLLALREAQAQSILIEPLQENGN